MNWHADLTLCKHEKKLFKWDNFFQSTTFVLLVARRATYVVDGRFFGHFFWKVAGTVCIHVNSRVAHVWLPYTIINVQGRGIANIGKLGKFGKLQFLIKVVGSISSHIGSHVW